MRERDGWSYRLEEMFGVFRDNHSRFLKLIAIL